MPLKLISAVAILAVLAGCSKSSTSNPPQNTTPNTAKTTVLYLVADGVTNNAVTLQNSIDSCSAVGGGTIEIPPASGQYMFGPIYMLSNVNLKIDTGATLLADPNMHDYLTGTGSLLDLIGSEGSNSQNISITGGGTIDGNGSAWWTGFNNGTIVNRPRLIYISNCTNLTLDGITLQNSPSFHFFPYQCTNVIANNLTILAPANSPNTDGIDPSQCDSVMITNCTINNGDDDIAIKAAGPCQGIYVKNCHFFNGHGLSVGSETYGNMTRLIVDSCTFSGTTNGIRLKSYIGDGGQMTNLKYSNITMTNVANPLVIDLTYSAATAPATYVPLVNGFTIDNLTVTGSSNAGSLIGLPNSLLENITLNNINISGNSPLVITNAQNVSITNAIINGVNVTPGSNNISATNVTGTTGF